jgi:hypothetical protein
MPKPSLFSNTRFDNRFQIGNPEIGKGLGDNADSSSGINWGTSSRLPVIVPNNCIPPGKIPHLGDITGGTLGKISNIHAIALPPNSTLKTTPDNKKKPKWTK